MNLDRLVTQLLTAFGMNRLPAALIFVTGIVRVAKKYLPFWPSRRQFLGISFRKSLLEAKFLSITNVNEV